MPPSSPSNNRKRRTFKAPANGEFYRSRSKRRIRPGEELSESEDDVSEDWLMKKHEEQLEDFADCTLREIRFMKLYDRFINQQNLQGYKYLPESLVRFAHSHKEAIQSEGLRQEFYKFLLNQKQYKRINNMQVKSIISVIPVERTPMVKQESPRTLQKSPRTPIGTRRSGVQKLDEGAFCLCKSFWSNGMVACSNEDCKIEWYHLACVNLYQRPTGRWVCPKYVFLDSLFCGNKG